MASDRSAWAPSKNRVTKMSTHSFREGHCSPINRKSGDEAHDLNLLGKK